LGQFDQPVSFKASGAAVQAEHAIATAPRHLEVCP
jgi:hypothetical protein